MTKAYINNWSDKDVEKHWDSVADIYIEENNKVKNAHDQRFVESIQYLFLSNGSKVLNITSRDCEANDYLEKQNRNVSVVNAEISKKLIDEAQKVRPYVKQVKLKNYSQLPFNDGEFDEILSLETLEHVKEPVQFLKELHRVSKSKSRLVLSCPPATSEIPYQVYTALFGGHGEGPHKFPSSKEVKKCLNYLVGNCLFIKVLCLFRLAPAWLQKWGEKIINRFQGTFIAELGIRQFYVCEKYR
ncbi:MAG: class I SAM-dependent methyltransferase [Bacteroidales bacterium]|nr:class I SAM-dependent methyltransferase [Bacteroidales bacterium]